MPFYKPDCVYTANITCGGYINQGWGQVQYLYLSTYLSVLDVLEYLVYGNIKVLVLVLDQKYLVLSK